MQFEAADARLQRRIIEFAVAGSAVAVWRGANDAFNIVKLTVIVVGALGVVLVGLWRVLTTGRLRVPRLVPLYAVAAFLALASVAVVTSDATWRSIVGVYGRGTGFATYLAGAVLLAGITAAVTISTAARVVRSIVVAAVLVALYGLSQRLGVDPYEWATPFGSDAATSFLGNANFVSGYLGATLPLAVWAAVTSAGRGRVVAAASTIVIAAGIVAARSQQGVVAAIAGLTVVAAVYVREHRPDAARRLVAAIVAVALLGGVALALGLAGTGPLRRLNDTGYAYRRDYWSASVEMANEEPVTGIGFDRWASRYRSMRSPEAAAVSLENVTDAPHSVPLSMLASGGYPLGLAYLLFVASVGWVAVRGLRRANDTDRLLLGAVTGSWLAYHVQSGVSIDVPALPTLHFVLAGLVLVVGAPVTWRTFNIPPLQHRVERRSSRKIVSVFYKPRLTPGTATAITGVLALVGLWQLTRPLRADIELRAARDALLSGDARGGAAHLETVFDIWNREAEYYSTAGDIFGGQQQAMLALRYYERAIELEPGRFADVLNASRAARASGDFDRATELLAVALELEPHQLELKWEVGEFLEEIGQPERAEPLIEAATGLGRGEIWVLLGDIRRSREDEAGAHQAYEEAFEVGGGDAGVLLSLAERYRQLVELDRARELAETALGLVPGRASALYQLARIVEDEGDVTRAIELFEAAEAVDYDDQLDAGERAEVLRSR